MGSKHCYRVLTCKLNKFFSLDGNLGFWTRGKQIWKGWFVPQLEPVTSICLIFLLISFELFMDCMLLCFGNWISTKLQSAISVTSEGNSIHTLTMFLRNFHGLLEIPHTPIVFLFFTFTTTTSYYYLTVSRTKLFLTKQIQ
jgi:hypothetical protein